MSAGRLSGRVAIVTGGASGIGRATALRFAAEGADIVIADLVASRCEAAVEDIRRSVNGRALAIETDVSVEDDIDRMVARALESFGRVDALVAAAGVSNASYVSGQVTEREASLDTTLLSVDVADWNRVLQINLTGVMLCDRAAARAMVECGNGGAIVNIASTAARIALPGAADYCVSKAGVEMLTRVLAAELIDHNIRVNAIGPGFIETPMTQGLGESDEGAEMMVAMTPMGRLGKPEEMADTALYLASDESSYMTGQILFPNGGMFVG
ncbi:MAG: SDR family oxidoreductase [Pseudomonadota bacterium]